MGEKKNGFGQEHETAELIGSGGGGRNKEADCFRRDGGIRRYGRDDTGAEGEGSLPGTDRPVIAPRRASFLLPEYFGLHTVRH